MTGTVAKPEGITNPSIDELLEHVDPEYALVAFSAAGARQINAYNQQPEAGLLDTIGFLVDYTPHRKALSIAMHEISQGMLDMKLQGDAPIQYSDLDDDESQRYPPHGSSGGGSLGLHL